VNIYFYRFAQVFVRSILTVGNRFSTIGAQNVPADGPAILVSNHVSYLDPPTLGCAIRRPVTYMAKTELFSIPVLAPIIRALGAFPVDRSRGDIAAIKQAAHVLETGAVLGMFPEGTRNRDGTVRPQLGVALLASMTGAPVVPAYLSGTSQANKLAKVTVVYGEPIRFEGGRKARREDLAKWTDDLMSRIYALRENIVGN
jgi:1-acyl-sn-glycerol-3-phosphate acyltransferase